MNVSDLQTSIAFFKEQYSEKTFVGEYVSIQPSFEILLTEDVAMHLQVDNDL